MLEPYIVIGGQSLLVLQRRVNLYVDHEGFSPIGHPFTSDEGEWLQAMYRAPEPQINTLAEAAESDDHEALAEFAERVEPPDPNWEQECERLRKRCSKFGQALAEARAGVKGAIRRAEAAEKERDEALAALNDVERGREEAETVISALRRDAGMDKPAWALDESDVEDMRDACDAAAEVANKTRPPRRIKIAASPAATVILEADEWLADEQGWLRVYRADECIAEFPAGRWLWVMADDPDQCDIGRKGP